VFKSLLITGLFALNLLFAMPREAAAFGEMVGACEPDCAKCHQITKQEASDIIKRLNPEIEVLDVSLGPVGGLWEVAVRGRGKMGIAYVDFSKQHVIVGSVFKVAGEAEAAPENLTGERLQELNKVDLSAVPLSNSILLGKADARYKVIVFSDPD
jgi:thiol:disulfide interchange protein DsbC